MADPITATNVNGVAFLALTTLESQFFYVAATLAKYQSIYNAANQNNQKIAVSVDLNFTREILTIQSQLPLIPNVLQTMGALKLAPIFTTVAAVPTIPSAANIPYTFSQSSVYNGTVGSYANLNDHDGSTGCLTSGGQSYLLASFPYPVQVNTVTVGGGTVQTAGLIAAAGLNGTKLQSSTDQTTWIDVLTVAGVQDSGGNQFITFPLSSPITAQYWRLFGNAYLGTTEFRFT